MYTAAVNPSREEAVAATCPNQPSAQVYHTRITSEDQGPVAHGIQSIAAARRIAARTERVDV